jgi:opacity protein-like surface antigen
MFKLTTIALTACALAAIAMPVQAADIPERPIPREVLGGWYLRGDIGYSNQQVDELFNVLYTGVGVTDVNNIHKEFDGGPTFGVGIGYQVNNWFRADVTGEYRSKVDFSGLDIITIPADPFPVVPNDYDAKKSEWLALLNGYWDIGSWHGISPFIGAGVGFANVEISSFSEVGIGSISGGPAMAYADDNDEWNFAWALHAGVGFEITEALTLELAYRYLDLGDAESGDLIASDGTNTIDNPMEFNDITSHDVKLGVRYTFW